MPISSPDHVITNLESMPMISNKYLICFIVMLHVTGGVFAQSSNDDEDLALAFGDEDFISIATGRSQLIARAPAVASVITSKDIKAIGATNLEQVLEIVPGLHVSTSPRSYLPIYTIRGIHSENNPQVLMLINDIPITNLFVGNQGEAWGGMPVNNISRIEIIRGPGSAVYGAEAFAGVINIITKKSSDISGAEIGARAGSFDTNDAWLLHGGQIGGFDTAFSLELHSTTGFDKIIEADAQSGLDTLFMTNASHAPDSVNTQVESVDARVDLTQSNWNIRLGYQGRSNLGTGAGNAQALDPTGSGDSYRINADLTFHDTEFYDSWDLTAQLSYFDTATKSDFILFPPGAFGGAYPDGMIGTPYVYERHYRLGISAFYTGFKDHQVRFGTGYYLGDMYKIEETKNFDATFAPLGSVIDASNDPSLVFIRPHDRNNAYLFVQDEWSMMADWDLTWGMRYDDYSEFGSVLNPRAALVWQTKYNLTSKLLFGRAFRAPAFNELYNINNPVALGRSDLDPETIDTIELAFGYEATKDIHIDLNLYHYEMSSILRFVPDPLPATTVTAQNTGNQIGSGFELEGAWEVNHDVTLSGNFAFQDSTDEDTDSDAANAPQRQLYIRADWEFRPDWTLNGQANWVADRKRAAGDARPEIDDYTTVDMTLRRKPEDSSWEFALSGHNIFDEDVREPSLAPGSIPNDLPLAGRSYYLEVGYHL